MSPRFDAFARPELPSDWWAKGLAARERGTGDQRPPEWANAITNALGTPAPKTAPKTPPRSLATEPFPVLGQAFRPLVAAAKEQVLRTRSSASVELPSIADRFAEQLTHRLGHLAARALVTELHAARGAGRLTAATSHERFAEFIDQTAADLGKLVTTYPVLGRALGLACLHAVDAQVQLLERFAADRTAIIETLLDGTDPGPLVGTRAQAGDLHHRGRSVTMLRFGDGTTVVYKPRCQRMQRFYGELVDWLNGKVPELDLRAPRTLCGNGYGWVEFIEHQPCTHIGEMDRFYRRQGALLALLHAVDGTDIHYENLIAHGDQPVLVDAETLFHPVLSGVSAVGPDPAALSFDNSVCRSSLLPQLVIGEHGALDLSGLGGDPGAAFPTASVGWADTGTDRMRVVRRPREFHGAQNRPLLAAKAAEPAEYQAALLAGFRTGYDAITEGREELAGLLTVCADYDTRMVLRPSSLYATLLDESTHPDVLRDGLDRERVFDLLRVDSADDPVKHRALPHEIADLWAGDLPFFTIRPGSRDARSAEGAPLPGLLATTGLRAATEKITNMGEVDRRFQEWSISASLSVRSAETDHRSGARLADAITPTMPGAQRFLAHACSVGDDLVATAVHDDRRANWVGLELVNGRHWMIQPLGAGLADGYLGPALFLAELGDLTGSDRYTALAHKAITPIPALLRAMAREPRLGEGVGPGGLLGLGGIAYALCRIGAVLGDEDTLDLLPSLIVLIAGMADQPATGIASGRAGALVALCGVFAETGLSSAQATATVFADRLLADVDERTRPGQPKGFAHGAAGVGYALLRFGELFAKDRHASTGRDLVLAAGSHPDHDDLGWCGGMAGVLLAHSAVPGAAGSSSGGLDDLVTTLEQRQPLRDTSLCHGELGVTEALGLLAEAGNEHARAALHSTSARLLTLLNYHGARCGTPDGVPSPGLLTGLAGIGYGLLRLGFPTRIPSVLALRPGTGSNDR